jgi:hypothetical protein
MRCFFMKKSFYIIGIIMIIIICYIFMNFLFFDKWACYSSEKQINSYINNHNTKKLHDIANNNKTYQVLKDSKKISIKLQSDNQGSGDIGYYQVDLNDKPAKLYIKIKHAFIPDVPEIRRIKLEE